MDDLGQVLRDLNGKAISHHVTYMTDPDDGRANCCAVTGWDLAADFRYHGTHWDLDRGCYAYARRDGSGTVTRHPHRPDWQALAIAIFIATITALLTAAVAVTLITTTWRLT